MMIWRVTSQRLKTVFLLSGLFGLFFVSAVAVAQTVLPVALVARGWEEITFDDKVPNRYVSCGADCIRVETDGSVSMIGKPVEVDLAETSNLSWEWRIHHPVTVSDLSKKGGDDRAVSVYVTFEFDPASASLGEILLRPMVKMIQGSDAPGRGLSYVWGGNRKRGEMFPSPYQEDSTAIIISRTADDPVGEWITETVDIVTDYRRAFGADPVGVTHVLVSADSDDVAGPNTADVRAISFSGG